MFDNLENLKEKKRPFCLSRRALIGSHPSSASKAHLGIFLLVRRAILVDFSNKNVYAADDGSHMEQPCVVVERSKALPNLIRLNLRCFPKILIIPFDLLSICV